MLQDIRNNSQSTAAKVVVGLIIVTFALFGAESIVGGLSGEPEVAVVNGEGITVRDFERAVEGRRRQILAQMGGNADPELIDDALLRSTVLDSLVNEKVLLLDAEEKGVYIAEAMVEDYIRNIPQFQIDGVFSNERMQGALRGAGLTLQGYKDTLSSQFMIEQARSALIASAFSLESETNEILALDRQTRDFGVATVYRADYLESIAVSDESVSAYHEEHKDDYKKPESVDVEYVLVDRQALAASVSIDESKVQSLYDSELDSFEGEEQRDASHILIKIDDETDEASALKTIQEISERIKQGESFENLAKELSQDEGSAQQGGALGMSGRGVYVSDFEDALYSLNEKDVSDPVKTEFGYHLIKLNAIDANKLPSYEDMKVSLEERLMQEELDQLYAELSENLADISYSSPDLEEVAEELELERLSLVGVNAQSTHEVFSQPRVQRVLFKEELVKDGNNSDVIEYDDGKALVFRVVKYNEPSVLSFDEVKEQIRSELKAEKANEFAKSVGNSFIARVKGGEDVSEVAKDMGLDWQTHSDVKRDNIMIDQEVISRVFTLKADGDNKNLQGFDSDSGNFIVVSLTAINKGDIGSLSDLELKSISNMLGSSFGATDYRAYQETASSSAEVEKL